MKALLKSQPILSFILLTFLITFTLWFLPVIISMPKDLGFAAVLIGGCGPLIAGLFITAINSKEKIKIKSKPIFVTIFIASAIILFLRIYFVKDGLSNVNGKTPTIDEISPLGYLLFGTLFFILGINFSNATNLNLKDNYIKSALFHRTKVKWYLIGLLFFVVLNINSYLLGNILSLSITDFFIKPEFIWVIGFFSTFLFFGGNEEFGWRGFLQKELQKKYNPLISTLVISFLWSLWHLPLHYNGFYSTGGFMDLLPRFILTIPITIIFTWLYNKSSYSILAVILMHSMLNNVDKAFGSSEIILIIIGLFFTIFCIINDKMWVKKEYHIIYKHTDT